MDVPDITRTGKLRNMSEQDAAYFTVSVLSIFSISLISLRKTITNVEMKCKYWINN